MALTSFLVSSHHLLARSATIKLTDFVSWWRIFILCIRLSSIFFLPITLYVFIQAMFPTYKTADKTMHIYYTTGVVTALNNFVAYIIHTALKHISTAPNYEYIVRIVEKTCKNYHAMLPRLGGSATGMLRARIPLVMYEVYVPSTPFVYPVVLVDNPVIPPGTTKQRECQIYVNYCTDQEE